jgi:hypothetical protein
MVNLLLGIDEEREGLRLKVTMRRRPEENLSCFCSEQRTTKQPKRVPNHKGQERLTYVKVADVRGDE